VWFKPKGCPIPPPQQKMTEHPFLLHTPFTLASPVTYPCGAGGQRAAVGRSAVESGTCMILKVNAWLGEGVAGGGVVMVRFHDWERLS